MAVTTTGVAIANLGVNTREWVAGLNKAQKKWVSFGATLQVTGFRIGAVWAATIGAMAVGIAKFGSSFEEEFVGIKKTITATTKQFADLKESLLDTAKATGMSADQLAILARKGGQLGVGIENIQKFTDVIAKLSIAAVELDPEAAATGLARLITITGASMSNIETYASVLARLGDSFATTEDRILNFSQRLAGLAKVTGIGTEGALALGAAFTATVPGVELVATQLSKGMAIMANAVQTGGEKLEVLNEIVKHTGTSFSTLFAVDATTAISEFLRGLDNVEKAGGNVFQVLRDLGLTNSRAAQAFLSAAGSADKFTEAIRATRDEVNLVAEGGGKLEKVFAEQMEMVSARWGQLWESIRAVAIRFFDAFSDEVKVFISAATLLVQFTEGIAAAFEILPTPVNVFIIALAALPGVVAAVILGLGMLVSVYGTIKPFFISLNALLGTQILAFRGATAAAGHYAISLKAASTSANTFTIATSAATAGSFRFLTVIKGLLLVLGPLIAIYLAFKEAYDLVNSSAIEATNEQEEYAKVIEKTSILMGDPIMMKNYQVWDRTAKSIKRVSDVAKGLNIEIAKIPNLDEVIDLEAFDEATYGMSENAKIMVRHLAELWGGSKDWAEIVETVTRNLLKQTAAAEANADALAAQKKAAEEAAAALRALMEVVHLNAEWADKPISQRIRDTTPEHLRLRGQIGDTFGYQFEELGDMVNQGRLPDLTAEIAAIAPEMDGVADATGRAEAAMKQFNKTLRMASKIGNLFGGSIGRAINSAIAGFGGLNTIMGAGEGGGFMSGIKGLFTAGKGVDEFGEEATGIMASIGGIMGAAGPIGAMIAPIFAGLMKAFASKPRWEEIAEEGAKLFGQAFSEKLAKQIEKSEEVLGDFGAALAANIGDIAQEVGVTAENLTEIWAQFFRGLDTGVASAEQLGKAFSALKDHLVTLGTEGSLQIGELVRRMREAGVVTEELTAHMKEQSGMLIDNLAPALNYIISLEDMTAEEATAMSGVIVVSWAAAIASTGSFIAAVSMLGDTFKEALEKIQEVLGPEGSKIIGPIIGIYNVISNNQEAFDAIYGLVNGLDQMAQMGILTKESLMAMGEAVRVTFNRILENTNDHTAALKATWPELVKLYDWYKKLGLEVPPWLQENIDLGKDMGLSMDVPMSTEQALNRMVEILEQIAIKLGAIAVEAENAGEAIGGMPMPGEGSDPGGGGGGPRGEGMQHGTPEEGVLFNQPTMIQVAEVRPERVWVENEGEGRMGGSDVSIGAINIEVSGAEGPEQTVKHIEANLEQSMTRIFRRAKQAGHV